MIDILHGVEEFTWEANELYHLCGNEYKAFQEKKVLET
jgi:hypothetical protein